MEIELKFLELKAFISKNVQYKGDLHMNLIGNNSNISINLFSAIKTKQNYKFQSENSFIKFGLFQGKNFIGIGKLNITNEIKWITIKCSKNNIKNKLINIPSEIKLKVDCKFVKNNGNIKKNYDKYTSIQTKKRINYSMDIDKNTLKKQIIQYTQKKNNSSNRKVNIYNKAEMKFLNKSNIHSIEIDSMLINDIITLSNDSYDEYSYIQLNNTNGLIFQNESEQLENNIKLNYSEDDEIQNLIYNLNNEINLEQFSNIKNIIEIPDFKFVKLNLKIQYIPFIKNIFQLFKFYYRIWIRLNKENKSYINFIKNYSNKIIQLKKKKCKLAVIRERERLNDELIFNEYGYSDFNIKISNLKKELDLWEKIYDLNINKNENKSKKRKAFLNEHLKFLFKLRNKSFDNLDKKQKEFILKLNRKILGNNVLNLSSVILNKDKTNINNKLNNIISISERKISLKNSNDQKIKTRNRLYQIKHYKNLSLLESQNKSKNESLIIKKNLN